MEQVLAQLITQSPVVISLDNSMREAADPMGRENVGRMPVVLRDEPRRVIGVT